MLGFGINGIFSYSDQHTSLWVQNALCWNLLLWVVPPPGDSCQHTGWFSKRYLGAINMDTVFFILWISIHQLKPIVTFYFLIKKRREYTFKDYDLRSQLFGVSMLNQLPHLLKRSNTVGMTVLQKPTKVKRICCSRPQACEVPPIR